MSNITSSLDDLMGGGFSFGNLQNGGVQVVKGKALEIPINDVEPDPEQPRKHFAESALEEMAESIRLYGVKSPISVREKAGEPGKYIINFGERRWRGSKLADKRVIPALIDNDFDPYVQVIENIEREDLAPMELALWIKKRLEAGEKKGAIAKKLGKDASYVTIHCALLELPTVLITLYEKGHCTDVRALYDLKKLHDQDAARIEAFCQSNTDTVSQIDVHRLAKQEAVKEVIPPQSAPEPLPQTTPVETASIVAVNKPSESVIEHAEKKIEEPTPTVQSSIENIVEKPSKPLPLRFVAQWKGQQVWLLLEEAIAGKVWVELIASGERQCISAHSVKLQGIVR